MIRSSLLAIVVAIVFAIPSPAAEANTPPQSSQDSASLRGPTSLAVADGFLWVGNATSGTISKLSLDSRQVLAEFPYGSGLSAIYAHPKSGLIVLDGQRHALVRVSAADPSEQKLIARVASHPERLALALSANRMIVSSGWGRAVTILTLDPSFEKVIANTRVALDFAPGELAVLDADGKTALVADKFGGKLAVVELSESRVRHTFDLPIQSIRGVALTADGKEVLLTHQLLDPRVFGERDNVHWGLLMANSLRGVRVADIMNPDADLMRSSWLDAIGAVGEGAGDPGAILVGKRWTAIVISGVDEVLVDAQSYRQRFAVGRRPSALALADTHLFVANRFDDSVTAIDLRSGKVIGATKLGPQRRLSSAERGERLFYDARLSLAGWMSCHSCHTDGHSTDKLADTLGDGDYGASKRILSLLGVHETGPWGWTASAKSLPEQVRKSVRTTMHGRSLDDRQVADLVAFLEQLSPPPQAATDNEALVSRGRRIFAARNCGDCHPAPLYTSAEAYDVQLIDEAGNRVFNPPSLRGVSQRDRFFHDGRFDNVRDVFRQAKHQLNTPLNEDEESALLAFLRSL